MNLISPITITDAIFHSSNIPELAPSECNGITALSIVDSSCVEGDGTYALIFSLGSPVTAATGTYTILSNVITNVTLTTGGVYYNALPAVATQSGDGHIHATWVDGNYRGEWSSIVNYSANAIVSVVASHRLYLSLKNTNIGYIPGAAGNSTWWLEYCATKRWLPFDGKVTNRAEGVSTITYELHPLVPINSMAILNIEAETVVVERRHGTFTGVAAETWTKDTYNDTLDLYVTDIVKMDFLTDNDPYFTITISNSLATAKVGEIVIGNKESIGNTLYNPTVGIIDYSTKEVDNFGNYTVLERSYSKRLTCTTIVQNTALDLTYNILASYRAIPVVWVGSEDYPSMIVYGFYKDFSIMLSYKTYSLCDLEVEGLV